MKNRTLVVAAALSAFALSGCATPKQTIAPGTPSLWLAEPCERTATRGIDIKVRFPAGEYRPIVRDADGIYYRPDAEILSPFSAALFDTDSWSVYVRNDGSNAVGGTGGIPNPLDRPLPFTSAPAAKSDDTPSR